MIIATGVKYRKPDLPDLARFEGLGVYYGATRFEASLCEGREVIVVGGGNSAGQAAVFLSRRVRHLHMLVRGEGLAATMSRYLIRRIEETPNITLRTRTRIEALEGNGSLKRVTWSDVRGSANDGRGGARLSHDGRQPEHGVAEGLRGSGRERLREDRAKPDAGRPRRLEAGRPRARRSSSRPVFRASSRSATCARRASSAWRRPSAKARCASSSPIRFSRSVVDRRCACVSGAGKLRGPRPRSGGRPHRVTTIIEGGRRDGTSPDDRRERRDPASRRAASKILDAVVAPRGEGPRRRRDRPGLQLAQRVLRVGRRAARGAPPRGLRGGPARPRQVGRRALLRREVRGLRRATSAALVALAKSREPGLPVFLLGHSAGGVVSCIYALEHQKELAGLDLRGASRSRFRRRTSRSPCSRV